MKKLIFILFILSTISVFSQEDVENKFDEPIQEFFVAGAVYPQEKNEIQITATDSYYKYEFYKTNSPALEIEYGITEKFQVGIGGLINTTYLKLLPDFNSYGTEISLLYSILNNKSYALSAVFETGILFSNSVYTETEIEYEPRIIFAKQLGNAQTHIGIGAGIGEETELSYDIAFLYPFKKVCPTFEINGMYDQENNLSLTPGIVCKPTDLFEIGVGIPYNLTNKNPSFGLIFGITFEFGD